MKTYNRIKSKNTSAKIKKLLDQKKKKKKKIGLLPSRGDEIRNKRKTKNEKQTTKIATNIDNEKLNVTKLT